MADRWHCAAFVSHASLCRIAVHLSSLLLSLLSTQADYFYDYLDDYILPDMGLTKEDAHLQNLHARNLMEIDEV